MRDYLDRMLEDHFEAQHQAAMKLQEQEATLHACFLRMAAGLRDARTKGQ